MPGTCKWRPFRTRRVWKGFPCSYGNLSQRRRARREKIWLGSGLCDLCVSARDQITPSRRRKSSMAACQWRALAPVVAWYLAVERMLRAGRVATQGRWVDLMARGKCGRP